MLHPVNSISGDESRARATGGEKHSIPISNGGKVLVAARNRFGPALAVRRSDDGAMGPDGHQLAGAEGNAVELCGRETRIAHDPLAGGLGLAQENPREQQEQGKLVWLLYRSERC